MEKVLCDRCSKCDPPYSKRLSIKDGVDEPRNILKFIGIQGKYHKAECATIGISANLNASERKNIKMNRGVIIDLLQYEEFKRNINTSLAELITNNNHLFFRQWQPLRNLEILLELAKKELLINIDMIKCRVDNCPADLLKNCFVLFIETLKELKTLKLLVFNGNAPVRKFLNEYFKKEKSTLLKETFKNRNREKGQIIVLKPESMTELKIDNKIIIFQKLDPNQYIIENYSNDVLNFKNNNDMVFIFMMHFSAYGTFREQLDKEMINLSNMLKGTGTL